MVTIRNNIITMNRQDTAFIRTIVLTPCNQIYELEDGDKLFFSVRKSPLEELDTKHIIYKEIVDRIIRLDSEDTKYLKAGKYFYQCIIVREGGIREVYSEGELYLK